MRYSRDRRAKLKACRGTVRSVTSLRTHVVTGMMAVATQSTGANQLWKEQERPRAALRRTDRQRHRRRGHRLGHRRPPGRAEPHPLRTGLHGRGRGRRLRARHARGQHHRWQRRRQPDAGRARSYVGMAPGAALISLKVLGTDGTGYVSDVIGAIDWAIANKDQVRHPRDQPLARPPASGSYEDDPMAKAVERAVAAGIVVVASAGNLGKLPDGTPIVGARCVARLHARRADGWRAEHARARWRGRTMGWRPTARAARWATRKIRRRGRSSRTWSRRATRLRRRARRFVPLGELPGAPGVRRQRRDVSEVVGIEHGGGGGERRGGAVAPGAAEADAGAGEVRAAVHGGAAARASA